MSALVRWRFVPALAATAVAIIVVGIAGRWWLGLACCFLLVTLIDWARRTVRRGGRRR